MTIRRHDLPVKVFLFNNRGYTSIRMTQNALFEGRLVGADFASGLANPDFKLLAAAYGLPYLWAADNGAVDAAIGETLALPGPAFCEVNISPEQVFAPKASAFRREDGTLESRPLEDMAPFLPREEIRENMHLFDGEPAP
jgi:acetolactate synthase-1/2/3 large subunit